MTKTYLILLTAGLVAVSIAGCLSGDTGEKKEITPAISNDSLVKRGIYLVNTMLCDDCHSPKRIGAHGPELIPELRLSGFTSTNTLPPVDTTVIKNGWTLFNPDLTSAVGAWGASFAANLTSDASGIGNWSLDQFKLALREGKAKGLANNRHLLPPMPWENIRKATDQDLEAIFAFLKSTKPVRNIVPAPKPLSELQ